jgi:hypothetical protein
MVAVRVSPLNVYSMRFGKSWLGFSNATLRLAISVATKSVGGRPPGCAM